METKKMKLTVAVLLAHACPILFCTGVTAQETKTAYVAEDEVNVRESASKESMIVGTLYRDDEVKVYGTNEDRWCWIESDEQKLTGFVKEERLYILEDEPEFEEGSAFSSDEVWMYYEEPDYSTVTSQAETFDYVEVCKKDEAYETDEVDDGAETAYVVVEEVLYEAVYEAENDDTEAAYEAEAYQTECYAEEDYEDEYSADTVYNLNNTDASVIDDESPVEVEERDYDWDGQEDAAEEGEYWQGTTTDSEAANTAEYTTADTRTEIVHSAMQYEGYSYTYGGNDPATGIDCSRFTQIALEGAGISNVPRTSETQYAASTKIDVSEVQPGDLLFYNDNGSGNPGHVAVYIGDGMIIHASSEETGVIVTDMNYGGEPMGAGTFVY